MKFTALLLFICRENWVFCFPIKAKDLSENFVNIGALSRFLRQTLKYHQKLGIVILDVFRLQGIEKRSSILGHLNINVFKCNAFA